jgi:hypothetical protein
MQQYLTKLKLKTFVGEGICFKLNKNKWYNVSLGTSDGEDILECEYLA